MSDEQVVARGMLSVLKKRLDALKAARAPHGTSSEKQMYLLAFEPLISGATVQRDLATLSGDGAFVATKVLVMASSAPAAGFGSAALKPFFDLYDLASGGRNLVYSQQNNSPLQGMPVTHFADTIDDTRAATYSAFTLPSEYLLPRNGSVELRLYSTPQAPALVRVALLGYKVYG